ncbi:hypothetical protein [Rhizobium sp. 32-5/1]|uniref:hypothetical protein n=1 Tax=Rhizobium sp. 32-5/1 TaxID=3019602 RepID=UPI0032B77F2B
MQLQAAMLFLVMRAAKPANVHGTVIVVVMRLAVLAAATFARLLLDKAAPQS